MSGGTDSLGCSRILKRSLDAVKAQTDVTKKMEESVATEPQQLDKKTAGVHSTDKNSDHSQHPGCKGAAEAHATNSTGQSYIPSGKSQNHSVASNSPSNCIGKSSGNNNSYCGESPTNKKSTRKAARGRGRNLSDKSSKQNLQRPVLQAACIKIKSEKHVDQIGNGDQKQCSEKSKIAEKNLEKPVYNSQSEKAEGTRKVSVQVESEKNKVAITSPEKSRVSKKGSTDEQSSNAKHLQRSLEEPNLIDFPDLTWCRKVPEDKTGRASKSEVNSRPGRTSLLGSPPSHNDKTLPVPSEWTIISRLKKIAGVTSSVGKDKNEGNKDIKTKSKCSPSDECTVRLSRESQATQASSNISAQTSSASHKKRFDQGELRSHHDASDRYDGSHRGRQARIIHPTDLRRQNLGAQLYGSVWETNKSRLCAASKPNIKSDTVGNNPVDRNDNIIICSQQSATRTGSYNTSSDVHGKESAGGNHSTGADIAGRRSEAVGLKTCTAMPMGDSVYPQKQGLGEPVKNQDEFYEQPWELDNETSTSDSGQEPQKVTCKSQLNETTSQHLSQTSADSGHCLNGQVFEGKVVVNKQTNGADPQSNVEAVPDDQYSSEGGCDPSVHQMLSALYRTYEKTSSETEESADLSPADKRPLETDKPANNTTCKEEEDKQVDESSFTLEEMTEDGEYYISSRKTVSTVYNKISPTEQEKKTVMVNDILLVRKDAFPNGASDNQVVNCLSQTGQVNSLEVCCQSEATLSVSDCSSGDQTQPPLLVNKTYSLQSSLNSSVCQKLSAETNGTDLIAVCNRSKSNLSARTVSAQTSKNTAGKNSFSHSNVDMSVSSSDDFASPVSVDSSPDDVFSSSNHRQQDSPSVFSKLPRKVSEPVKDQPDNEDLTVSTATNDHLCSAQASIPSRYQNLVDFAPPPPTKDSHQEQNAAFSFSPHQAHEINIPAEAMCSEAAMEEIASFIKDCSAGIQKYLSQCNQDVCLSANIRIRLVQWPQPHPAPVIPAPQPSHSAAAEVGAASPFLLSTPPPPYRYWSPWMDWYSANMGPYARDGSSSYPYYPGMMSPYQVPVAGSQPESTHNRAVPNPIHQIPWMYPSWNQAAYGGSRQPEAAPTHPYWYAGSHSSQDLNPSSSLNPPPYSLDQGAPAQLTSTEAHKENTEMYMRPHRESCSYMEMESPHYYGQGHLLDQSPVTSLTSSEGGHVPTAADSHTEFVHPDLMGRRVYPAGSNLYNINPQTTDQDKSPMTGSFAPYHNLMKREGEGLHSESRPELEVAGNYMMTALPHHLMPEPRLDPHLAAKYMMTASPHLLMPTSLSQSIAPPPGLEKLWGNCQNKWCGCDIRQNCVCAERQASSVVELEGASSTDLDTRGHTFSQMNQGSNSRQEEEEESLTYVSESCAPSDKVYQHRVPNRRKLSLAGEWSRSLLERSRTYQNTFIDCHCHIDLLYSRLDVKNGLTFSQFRQDHAESFPYNYEGCVAVFCNPQSFIASDPKNQILKMMTAENYVWIAAGCHPKNAIEFSENHLILLRQILKYPRVVAVGEIGLDYSGTFGQHAYKQKQVFRQQLQLAMELQLPVVIHCREADQDCLEILLQTLPSDYKIHVHCFSRDIHMAMRWIHPFPNLFMSLTPKISHLYRASPEVTNTAANIPLDRLLLETDAPYFVPCGKMEYSHPGLALLAAEKVAELRNISVDEVLHICRNNTHKMYGI